MKRYPWLSYLLLFTLFFPIGYWTGSHLSPTNRKQLYLTQFKRSSSDRSALVYPLPAKAEEPQSTEKRSENIDNIQTNTLILLVNELNSPHTSLTSAWLLIRPQGESRLIFLPIFQETNLADDLISTFQVDQNKLSKRFVKAIEKRNILWHSFVILDQQAQKQLMAGLAETTINDPMLSLNFLRITCEKISSQPQLLTDLMQLIPQHLTADFDLQPHLEYWQFRLIGETNLLCEFPTLAQ